MLIFGLSSVLSGREGWHYVLIFGYPLFFQAGKILKMSYPLFQAGKVSITC